MIISQIKQEHSQCKLFSAFDLTSKTTKEEKEEIIKELFELFGENNTNKVSEDCHYKCCL